MKLSEQYIRKYTLEISSYRFTGNVVEVDDLPDLLEIVGLESLLTREKREDLCDAYERDLKELALRHRLYYETI